MNKLTCLYMLVFLPSAAMAQCFVPLEKSSMELKTVGGKEVYVVDRAYVDQSECLDLAQIEADLKRIEALETTLAEYQSLSGNMANNIQSYRDINTQLSQTLERSFSLTEKYDQQLTEYDKLSNEFDQLAQRYDQLAGKYRDIALGSSSLISFDAGIGVDEDSEITGLVGIGFKNLRAWGFLQNDNSGLIVGGSLPF